MVRTVADRTSAMTVTCSPVTRERHVGELSGRAVAARVVAEQIADGGEPSLASVRGSAVAERALKRLGEAVRAVTGTSELTAERSPHQQR